MTQASKLISPLDAEYAEHREDEARRRNTREWLMQRERDLGFIADAPSVTPEKPEGERNGKLTFLFFILPTD